MSEDSIHEYTFEYNFTIVDKNKITWISAEQNATKVATPTGYIINLSASNVIPKREIRIFYKTENMLEPQLKYKVDSGKNEVACMISFVPTFEPKYP
jgi:hypothetical protein